MVVTAADTVDAITFGTTPNQIATHEQHDVSKVFASFDFVFFEIVFVPLDAVAVVEKVVISMHPVAVVAFIVVSCPVWRVERQYLRRQRVRSVRGRCDDGERQQPLCGEHVRGSQRRQGHLRDWDKLRPLTGMRVVLWPYGMHCHVVSCIV